uniref:Plastid-encoded RNA polymerase subunit alpha n=1 Tax=Rhipilia penicilloides TaxID=1979422 RepID=A0A2P0QIZ1_9CHLO|nr:RNA polymerase a-subunit [Rhipilia penicilloides]ARO74259.1 RNA polymerase a-subunit [Rhipilia penicilloides]
MNLEKNFYCISSRIEKNGQLYGCFKIGPFFESQSCTFANTLRRTLLADQSRSTFQAVQIYGVTHEFSHLVGLRESIVDLVLNLEKIVFQTTQPLTKPQIAFLHSHGPKKLRAQHLCLPPGWRCVRPDQYIATLEVDGQLLLKLFFSPNFSLLGRPGFFGPPQSLPPLSGFPSKRAVGLPTLPSVKKKTCFSNNFWLTFQSRQFKNWPIFEQLSTFHHPSLFGPSFRYLNYVSETNLGHFFYPSKKPSKKKTPTLSLKKDIFQKQENFLLLNSSLCTIEKAHYTLQTENHRRFPTTSLFFEVWTDGSLHPQTAIFKALKQILLEIFAYSLQITKSEKMYFLKTKQRVKLSTDQFQEKFLHLEIGNFHLDFDTYIFLKKNKIYKIMDFCFFFKNANWQNCSPVLKKTLYKFYFFIQSMLDESLMKNLYC